MTDKASTEHIQDLLTRERFNRQYDAGRRFKACSFTQGLRKGMECVRTEDVQEVIASRDFELDSEPIAKVSNSSVSEIASGFDTQKREFNINFNKEDYGDFPWNDIKAVLDQPSTLYDVPIRRFVIQFRDEDFVNNWIETVREGLDVENPPINWIETPFFAVLESKEPGVTPLRKGVRREHSDYYYSTDSEQKEFPWPIRTLDFESVWSYQAYINDQETILTTREAGKTKEWTAREIEYNLMNYFDPEDRYSGVLQNSNRVSDVREILSLDVTSTKTFEWVEGEEWSQVSEEGG